MLMFRVPALREMTTSSALGLRVVYVPQRRTPVYICVHIESQFFSTDMSLGCFLRVITWFPNFLRAHYARFGLLACLTHVFSTILYRSLLVYVIGTI